MKEIEVKATIANIEPIKEKLINIGCQFTKPSRESDVYFRLKSVAGIPRSEGDALLRVRSKDDRKIFMLKKMLGSFLANTEYETVVIDASEIHEAIVCMDYVEIARVIKTRIKIAYEGLEICLDWVEGLGGFIEVETLTEDVNERETQSELWKILMELGIYKDARVEKGYSTLMWELNMRWL